MSPYDYTKFIKKKKKIKKHFLILDVQKYGISEMTQLIQMFFL